MTVTYGYEKNNSGITLTDIYGKADAEIVLPGEWKGQKVTQLGEALIRGQQQVTEIVVPEGVTAVGWWVFGECPNLKYVVLPKSLLEIGYRAFSGCTALQQIALPPNIEQIGEAAFWGCTALKRIALPPKLNRIRNRTFYGCSHLTDIEIPPAVDKIEWGAFEHCKGLRSLTIPDGVTEIGSNALRECSGLKELNFPDQMAAISENLFGLRHLPPLERGYMPNVDLSHWEEGAKKILALCYLTTAQRHEAAEQEMYEQYIRIHRHEVISLAVSLADIPALSGLYAMGLPEEAEIDRYIDAANAMRRRDAVVSLLEYKHKRGKRVTVAQRLAAEFSIDDDFDF